MNRSLRQTFERFDNFLNHPDTDVRYYNRKTFKIVMATITGVLVSVSNLPLEYSMPLLTFPTALNVIHTLGSALGYTYREDQNVTTMGERALDKSIRAGLAGSLVMLGAFVLASK